MYGSWPVGVRVFSITSLTTLTSVRQARAEWRTVESFDAGMARDITSDATLLRDVSSSSLTIIAVLVSTPLVRWICVIEALCYCCIVH